MPMTNLRGKYWQAVALNYYGVPRVIGFYACRNSARNALRKYILKHQELDYTFLIREFNLAEEKYFEGREAQEKDP